MQVAVQCLSDITTLFEKGKTVTLADKHIIQRNGAKCHESRSALKKEVEGRVGRYFFQKRIRSSWKTLEPF